ncbi:hypothetical protein N7508_007568 [Penicillium antarcticum]|uniref:uncharacterized protein n=1 Tax=Penicillium antarcticum TaxID=416450 RepID=UPI0023A6D67B|nr:uncharacterized protein N7508_007568 [Penicillium antarcticum]KAJ5297319.1 hypothetical protein N7508_007568 [Penicillium antarcticum]
MPDSKIPQPGPAKLKRNAGPDEWLEAAKDCKYLSEPHMKQLCEIVKEYMMEESNIQPVSTPVTVCGDIHGQFYDLLELFRVSGGMPDGTELDSPKTSPSVITSADIEPPSSITDPKIRKKLRGPSVSSKDEKETGARSRSASDTSADLQLDRNFVFLGDYVDRGYFSLETLTLLLCLKAKYPDRVTLVRGNHESRQITQVYGFYEECFQKYGSASVWKACCQVFDFMTLGAIIDGKVLCVHGGLSPEIRTLDQVRVVARAQEIPHEGAFCDLVWSDPDDVETWAVSPRGAGWLFGDRVADEFCHVNDLSLIARAHQLVNEGYKYHFNNQNVVTVWSAPNYCYRCGNLASVCEIGDDLKPTFKLFSAVSDDQRHVPTSRPGRSEYFLGSAGLCAATWLARYGVRCKVLERRDGPMKMGQADGVQCRTVEIFESFGIGEELLREAYHVLEVNFWADNGAGVIKRTGRTADTQPGLSHQPHVILNQARINGLLIELMHQYNNQQIDYGYNVTDVEVNSALVADHDAHPIKVTAEKNGKTETFAAKYALGCDGAHSVVRKALGYKMIGDSSDAVWGVMDMVPRTDFPDIRKKSTIRSQAGNILIIPREGESNNLTRFYIELAAGTNPKEVTLENLQAQAQSIFHPYKVEFVETVWWSAYAIGQRHADFFHKDNRVFLAGDACHTHSPKAGQGMNVSLQDGYNIGWKLGEILTGLATPSLLETYVLERQKVAIDLINFDRYFSKIFSSGAATSPAEFQEGFVKSGRYTAGLTAKYEVSPITSALESAKLASNVVVGMRLPSAQVVRFCDSQPMQLMKCLKSDGRWRIMAFVGDLGVSENQSKLSKLGDYLCSEEGPIHTFTPKSQNIDSLIETVVIGHGKRHEIELEQIPECFYPLSGKNQTRDLHKIYYDDESYNQGHGHAYEFLGIDPTQGAIIIVRPDQYVSAVMRPADYIEIGKFFAGFLKAQTGTDARYPSTGQFGSRL